MKRFLLIFVIAFVSSFKLQAQIDTSKAILMNDTVPRADKKKLYNRPRTATILSVLIPGAGQVYNRKFWKPPLIYAGMAGFGYWFYYENGLYSDYAKNLRYEYDDDPETINNSGLTGDVLSTYKAEHKRYRDLAIIGLSVVYILNIIDANVDAHLKTFDVSDDLSLQADPWIQAAGPAGSRHAVGISVKLIIR